jgi:LysR family glycine cleavage system transcriptional activator
MSSVDFKNLPPLPALAAFEAVARLQSFGRAAEELCVTHGAVSHRIKLLEEHYNTRLFVRRGGSVSLTTDGTYFLSAVLEGLSILQKASTRLTAPRRVVTISAGPTSARNWLMARLGDFYRAHAEIDLEITATKLTSQKRRASLEAGEADIAVRYGRQDEWSGLTCVKLMDVQLFPVCSPDYVTAIGGFETPQALSKAVLLRLPHEPWKPWFDAAGLAWEEPASGPCFGDASLMLEAVANAQGVALARDVLVERDLAAGRLVKLFDTSVSSTRAYYAVLSSRGSERAEVRTFLEWLIAVGAQPVRGQAA